MADDVLDKLFGSPYRARLLRLFLEHPDEVFEVTELAGRARVPRSVVQREMRMLSDIDFTRKAAKIVSVPVSSRSKKIKKKKVEGWMLNPVFAYLHELTGLVNSTRPVVRQKIASGLRKIGKVELVVITGKLVDGRKSIVDVFFVGKGIRKSKIEHILKKIEAQIGYELIYALMPTDEFRYRYGMHDRFIRDLFDNPHEVLVDKIGVDA